MPPLKFACHSLIVSCMLGPLLGQERSFAASLDLSTATLTSNCANFITTGAGTSVGFYAVELKPTFNGLILGRTIYNKLDSRPETLEQGLVD
jgi:hypothetical protein